MRSFIEIIIAAAVFLAIYFSGVPLRGSAAVIGTAVLITVFQVLRQESWQDLGLKFPTSIGSFFGGFGFSLLALIGVYIAAFSAHFFNTEILNQPERNLPEISTIPILIKFLVISWTSAAIGEELVFRGFLMTRLADVFGRKAAGWTIALIISSVVFGVGHAYQALPGIVLTGMVGFSMGLFYLLGRRNLLPLIIAHGIVDTLSMVGLYMISQGMVDGV